MRYLVFQFTTHYPEGGMNDCILKTNELDAVLEAARIAREDFYHVHAYDTLTDEFLSLPEED